MIKRVVIKTIVICCGCFLVFLSILLYIIFNKFPIETEKKCSVVVASEALGEGHVLKENMVTTKIIKESALNGYMITEPAKVIGKRLTSDIKKDDYICSYRITDDSNSFSDGERLIPIELSTADRSSGIIKKASYVDVIVKYEKIKKLPEVVLSKVKIEDLADAAGNSLESCVGGKVVYAKLRLDKGKRQRLYLASELGKLYCETYGSNIQNPANEEFIIPEEYLNKSNTQK